jgi:hypothetical protein
MAEMKELPTEIWKSLVTGLVFLPKTNGVRRAKPNTIATSFISAPDPPRFMIRSFALSGAEGRVFMPQSPFFLAKSTQRLPRSTAEAQNSEIRSEDDWLKLFFYDALIGQNLPKTSYKLFSPQ